MREGGKEIRHTQRDSQTYTDRSRKRKTERDRDRHRDRKREREIEFDNNDHLLVIIVSQHTVIKYTCLLKVSFKFVHN